MMARGITQHPYYSVEYNAKVCGWKKLKQKKNKARAKRLGNANVWKLQNEKLKTNADDGR